MAQVPIMPDIPWDYAHFLDDNPDLIVLTNNTLIKRIFVSDTNLKPLWELKDLDLEHFHTPKKIFIDEFYMYYYLLAPYLENHQNLKKAIQSMSIQDILRLFKTMLKDLQVAHQNELQPFDITPYNYLVDQDHTPKFIDFDHSFYKGKATSKETRQTLFDISYFNRNPEELTESNIVLNDKILLLSMLINSLLSKNILYSNPNSLRESLEELRYRFRITKEILDYLEFIIIKREIPFTDDYFIDTVINPLIDISSTLTKK